jgi:hypothetical protein
MSASGRGAQIRHHAFADDRDQVVARGARHCEHGRHRDHHGEILIDQPDALGREALIDHAAHRERHHQRGGSRDQQRDQRGRDLHAVAHDVGEQGQQRAHAQAARRWCIRWSCHHQRYCGGLRPAAGIVHGCDIARDSLL